MEIKLQTLTSLIPVGALAVAGITSWATLSSDVTANEDDIADNEKELVQHAVEIRQNREELLTLKHKVDTVSEVTSETKDDVKQLLLLMQQSQR